VVKEKDAKRFKEQMTRPDLVFITKENEAQFQDRIKELAQDERNE
jgi:hypothetical protein